MKTNVHVFPSRKKDIPNNLGRQLSLHFFLSILISKRFYQK